jgi:hypothetical protein
MSAMTMPGHELLDDLTRDAPARGGSAFPPTSGGSREARVATFAHAMSSTGSSARSTPARAHVADERPQPQICRVAMFSP